MSRTKSPFLTKPYSAYHHRDVPEDDKELTRVGPGTPAGDYLRRFWQPVAYARLLKDLPTALKIMDEELVLFRDKSGRVGLVEAHCPHRGTSFEFGKIEQRGIRCCYHSWLVDVDGKILETPGEPENSTLKDKLYHGAYPVREFRGLIFAYMGPSDKMPELPAFDIFDAPGRDWEVGMSEGRGAPTHIPCNWLQDVDNFVDIQHEEFLHATISQVQFLEPSGRPLEELAIIGATEYMETPIGILTLAARRVRPQTVWVRNIEFAWPNIAILGRSTILMDHQWGPEETEVHSLPRLVWAVPIDDTNHMMLDMVHMPIGGSYTPTSRGGAIYPAPTRPKSYDDMQREPGDYEAQISQRLIAVHALEHLATTDRGIIMLRKGLRRRVRMVQRGQDPPELQVLRGRTVSTHGGDTLLRVPQAPTPEEDEKLLKQVARELGRRYLQRPPNVALER
jgi:nitrite reductase/ring-hydroxylating ferredoxin subunit